MKTDSSIFPFQHPDEISDPLTSVLRNGARQLLAQAVEAEAATFLAAMRDERLDDGRARLVRHGHAPERTIQTGIGPVPVRRPRLRDRGAAASSEDRIRFTSTILPKWARRTMSLDALLPVLYLRGISTGDFQEALSALLGRDAPNLSPSVIGRLKDEWASEYERWQQRDLAARRYVYIWADGVYLQARMEDNAACMLVVIGATPEGRKELVGFKVGVRESAQSWRELLIDLKTRGLSTAPEIAVGDGALVRTGPRTDGGLGPHSGKRWMKSFPQPVTNAAGYTSMSSGLTRGTANVLNKVPKSVQPNMKVDLREVRDAPDRASAETAITVFAQKYGAKYPKATECLTKDGDALLSFFDFPAEHWDHLRTSNPIESVFATVRHRTVRTRGALSQKTARLMVFKLVIAAAKTWRRLKGDNQLPLLIAGVKFTDGVAVNNTPEKNAA